MISTAGLTGCKQSQESAPVVCGVAVTNSSVMTPDAVTGNPPAPPALATAPAASTPTAGPALAQTSSNQVGNQAGSPAASALTGGITEAEARAFLDAWLAAQNRGDFGVFQAMYAADMTGIRRSGKRTIYVDRAGWMRERQRQFRKPMVVTAERLSLVPRDMGLHLYFTQTWESGSQKRIGRKLLVLTRERDTGALKILWEEMLDSQVVPPSAAAPDLAGPAPTGERAELPAGVGLGSRRGNKLSLAFVHAGEVYLALLESDIGVGPASRVQISTDAASGLAVAASARRAANMQAIPPELAALRGKEVQVYGRDATALCTARIGNTFDIVAADWLGKAVYGEAAVAQLWSQGLYIVVASLHGDRAAPPACVNKAAFVRDATLPLLALPAPLAANALASLQYLTSVAAESAAEARGDGTWDDVSTSIAAMPGGGAVVGMQLHTLDTCDTQEQYRFTAQLARMSRRGEWSLEPEFETRQEESLLFAADVDSDGVLEILTTRGVYTADTGYQPWIPDLRVFLPTGMGCEEWCDGPDC